MASSNRHWPSMFKSKPCNSTSHQHHQWQHEINSSSLVSSVCNRSPFTSVTGCEERSPEPKPRWNPKPEQIRILEAIFNSGMVNPPRDEIRKIRAQLQEYGQVGDANVFYWFQNRKSRSKHKLRLLQNSSSKPNTIPNHHHLPAPAPSSSSSSSSSSEKLSPPDSSKRTLSLNSQNLVDLSNSPTASVNQNSYFTEFPSEPFLFPAQQAAVGPVAGAYTQGFCFSDLSNEVQVQDHVVGPCTSLLLSEIVNSDTSKKDLDHKNNMKMQPFLDYSLAHTIGLAPRFPPVADTHTINIVSSTNTQIQGVGDPVSTAAAARSTVFINDVAIEVGLGPFNVREAFGDNIMLIHSSGYPVFTNEWGFTLHSLQHGASYYLVPLSMAEPI